MKINYKPKGAHSGQRSLRPSKPRMIMKTNVTIIAMMACMIASAQIRFNDVEYFTISTSIDPGASIKEGGINILAEIEYSGLIYAKAGFESFEALKGGYFDVHGAIGLNLNVGRSVRTYAGLRAAVVFRNDAPNAIHGFEGGIDYNVSENFFVGVRGTYDHRYDMKAFQWPVIWRESFFIRIGYKWNWKG